MLDFPGTSPGPSDEDGGRFSKSSMQKEPWEPPLTEDSILVFWPVNQGLAGTSRELPHSCFLLVEGNIF